MKVPGAGISGAGPCPSSVGNLGLQVYSPAHTDYLDCVFPGPTLPPSYLTQLLLPLLPLVLNLLFS